MKMNFILVINNYPDRERRRMDVNNNFMIKIPSKNVLDSEFNQLLQSIPYLPQHQHSKHS